MPSSEQALVRRDPGLDAFRGLTVALMILVNLQGSAEFTPAQLKHASWHGLTITDLVFPWFLLIVGISIAFASDRRRPPALSAVFRRSLVIFAIGVVLGWAIRPTLDPEQIRWSGVLQRIAIVYLACVLLARVAAGWLSMLLAATLCLVVHTALLLFVTAPGEAGPSLGMGEGISGWMDRAFLPGRLHRDSWDPEGVLGTFSSFATGLLGIGVARFARQKARHAVVGLALVLFVGGLALSLLVPLNKALWTASFVLVAVGSGLPVWLLLSALARRNAGERLLRFAVQAGQTALTFYVAHMLLIAVLVRRVDGISLWERGFAGLTGLGLPGTWASVLFALLAGALAFAPMSWLKRRGLLIRA